MSLKNRAIWVDNVNPILINRSLELSVNFVRFFPATNFDRFWALIFSHRIMSVKSPHDRFQNFGIPKELGGS